MAATNRCIDRPLTAGRLRRKTAGRRSRAGFTFIEILFSVMILGVGFIMLAAMFPAAVRQTETTRDLSVGRAVAQDGATVLGSACPNDKFDPTAGAVQRLSADSWDFVRGSVVVESDHRYAWVPLYSKFAEGGSLRATIIAVRCRNFPAYEATRDTYVNVNDTHGYAAALQPHNVTVRFIAGTGNDSDAVELSVSATDLTANTPAAAVNAAATGAFLVLGTDNSGGGYNGRIYRLGEPKDAASHTWYLQPGYDLHTTPGLQPTGGTAWMVGRGYVDPRQPQLGYAGLAQDVAVYQTMVVPPPPAP